MRVLGCSLRRIAAAKFVARQKVTSFVQSPRFIELGHCLAVGEELKRVSSEASSSGLIKIAAGRPLRVTMIRSWVCSTRSTISENLDFTFANDSVSDMTNILVML